MKKEFWSLYNKILSTREYKQHVKFFKEMIDGQEGKNKKAIIMYLYFDFDEMRIKVGSEYQIPHNTLVLQQAYVNYGKDERFKSGQVQDVEYNSVAAPQDKTTKK